MTDLSKYNGKALMYTRPEDLVNSGLYTSLVTEIPIKSDMFHEISGKLSPAKGLVNQIGTACGIEFMSNIKVEDVFGDEVTYPDGRKIRQKTGVRVITQGRKMRPDGSWHLSSPCVSAFSFVDKATEEFLIDESYGGKKFGLPPNENHLARAKVVTKYKNVAEERAHTGSQLRVIRELTGMETGFTKKEVATGLMVFSQVIKSSAYQKEEARARVDNIRNNGTTADEVNEAAAMLTGQTPDVKEDFDEKFDRPKPAPAAPEKSQAQLDLEALFNNPKVTNDLKEYYTFQVQDNGDTDDVIVWAIDEIKRRAGI